MIVVSCRLFLRSSLTVLCPLVLGSAASWVQAAPPATPAVAHVRVWKTDLKAFSVLRATLKVDGRHGTTQELASDSTGYTFGNYVDVPFGRVTFEAFAGTDKRALRSLSAELAPGAFATLLLNESEKPGDAPRLQLIDDGGTASPHPSAQITVRCFVPGLKEIHVALNDSLNAVIVAEDGFLRMRGIKPMHYLVHTSGIGPDGKPFDWINETDLRPHRRQTLLVVSDAYGRIRPRLVDDGESIAPSPDPDVERAQ